MSREFWSQSPHGDIEHDDEHVANVAMGCIQNGMLAVLADDSSRAVGFCCGVVMPTLANPTVRQGTELAWWIDPEYRGKGNGRALLEFMEIVAREAECSVWTMVAMTDPDPAPAEALYQRHGYTLVEKSYSKRL